MKNIIIRHARPKDSLDIARVQVETWHTAYKWIIPDSYLSGLNIHNKAMKWEEGMIKEPNRPIFIAIIDDQVVGFVSGSTSCEKQEYDAEITAFYVLDMYQGKWIGKMLFKSMIEEFRKRTYGSFYLWVLSTGPARGFYEYMWGQYIDEKVEKKWEIELSEISYGWNNI